jgi:O-antigen ligase
MDDSQRVRLASAAFALLALAGAAVNLLDFYQPLFTQIPGRAAGLYTSPTIAGNFIALAMVAGSWQIPPRWRWWYVMFCGAGIAVTFSRESWILWGAAVPGLAWAGVLGAGRARWLSLSAAVVVGVGLTLSLFLGQAGRIAATSGVNTYLTPDTAARLGFGASSLSGEATSQRLYGIRYSLEVATDAPVLGHGLGYTRIWDYFQGPHNMFLLFLVEGGVIGLALYLSLLGILWRTSSGIGRVLAVQLLFSSFFSHNHLEQPAILLIVAFIVVHGVMRLNGR